MGRSTVLSALIRRVPGTDSGASTGVMLTGPAGVGRSALLHAFCDLVQPWASVLRADTPDGTWYDAAEAMRGAAPRGRSPFASTLLTCHQLHETVMELCRRGPVVLAMDDAHLPRPRSLRALDYVLRRSVGLPLLPVITTPPVAEPPALAAVLTHHPWAAWELRPLTADEISELLFRKLGHEPSTALLRRCAEQSEGIPAAVHAFVDRYTGTGGTAGGDHATPQGFRQLPSSASAVLSAVAVLGCSEPELVSELIRMPLPTVRRALDHLAERRILPLDGARAGSREPDDDDMPAGLASDDLIPLYARAARLLEDAGRPPTQVAQALLRIRFGAAPWMLEALYSAALATDSPRAAVRYLSHALDIGAGENTRTLRRIRGLLADTLGTVAPDLAVHHLSTLLASSTDGHELAELALRYTDTLVPLGRGDEAARLLADVLDRRPGSSQVVVPQECRAALESALLLSGALEPGTVRWVKERLRTTSEPCDDSPGNRRLRLARAALSVLSGRPVPEHRGLSAVGTPGTPGTPLDDLSMIAAAVVANLADDNTTALATLDRLLANPPRGELDPSRIQALAVRALVLSATGDLPAAERDSRQALELERRRDDGPAVTSAVVFAYVLAQRGSIAAAAEVLSEVGCADLRHLPHVHPLYWWATAAIRREHGDLAGALVALRAAGRVLGPQGAESPLVLPWWLETANLLRELGRPAEARQVAAQGAALLGRCDTPRGAGLLLLARGLATPGRAGHRLLDDACSRLAESPARLLRARAEYALGSALLDTGDPLAARPRLRTALNLTIGCGAGNAATGIRVRLAEAGGRPRQLSGRPNDALTARERRVAVLAMAGRSNREIAETLYITRRTVELHLTHAYQKLGVSGREDLVGVLKATGMCASPSGGGAR